MGRVQSDIQAILTQQYGIPFPDSFFAFAEFVQTAPPQAFSGFDSVPHVVLGEIFKIFKPDFNRDTYRPLWDSRFYNDPPEFLTVLDGEIDGKHWGLYLEDPTKPEWLAASFYSNDAFEISLHADLFTAMRAEIEYAELDYSGFIDTDPKYADTYRVQLEACARLREHLMRYGTGDRPEHGEAYTDKYSLGRVVTVKTRDGVGLTVPPALYKPLSGNDPFTIWNYQPTPEEVRSFERDALQALADGYPATALKLGKDLWVYSAYFETTFRLLDAAYEALKWSVLRDWLRQARARREDFDSQQH